MDSDENYLDLASDFMKKLQTPTVTPDGLCRVLALSTFKDIHPVAIFMYGVHSEGFVSFIASFGLSSELKTYLRDPILLTVDLPSTRAVRNNKLECVHEGEELHKEFPALEEIQNRPIGDSLVAIPIRKSGVPVGVLTIVGRVMPMTVEKIKFLELMSLMVATKFTEEGEFIKMANAGGSTNVHLGIPLTEREYLIQGLMAEGQTNAEIAKQLGFSESTIRQDSVRLFAKLGVNNRIRAAELYKKNRSPSS